MAAPVRLGKVALAAALTGALGCATARNYDDARGPILVGPPPAVPQVRARATDEVRLVTYNIKFGQHVDRAAVLLSRYGPLKDADVVFLQEMDQPATEELAQALGMNYVYVPSAVHPSSGRDFGVAILSPWLLSDPRKVPLPHVHRFRKLRRSAAAATVFTPAGPLRVYAVHFETAFGLWRNKNRRDQARAVLTEALEWAGPIAIAGDFNGRSGAEEIAKGGFLWMTERLRDRARVFDFDHVLVRGLCAAAKPAAGRARDDLEVSDHRPVWAVVRPCAS
jgi:endonuclease/exonuclease/phosphatase family metal-dependent hydrolase